MLKKTRISYSVSLILSLVFAIGAAAIRIFMLFSEYDVSLGHFDSGSVLNTAFFVLIITAALFFIVPCIFIMKEQELRTTYTDLPTVFSSAFLSVVLFLFAVFVLIEAFKSEKAGAALVFSLFSSLFALLSVPYYIMRIFEFKPALKAVSVFSFFPVLLGCSLAFAFYFDSSMYMNSPITLLHQASAIFIAFFSLGECRVILNRVLWGLYTFVGFVSFILTFSDSLPLIVYIPSSEAVSYESTASLFLIFAFSLYIISRIFSVYSLNSTNAQSLISFFKTSYEKRKEDAQISVECEVEQLPLDLEGKESNEQDKRE